MPTYQYACTESTCGHRFDAVQGFSDDPLTACPVCEGRLRKVFSAVGVVFKGSGFYRTDSRNEGRRSAGKSSGSDASKPSESAGSSESSASSTSSGSSGSSGADKAPAKAGASSASSASSGSGSSGSAKSTSSDAS